MASVRHRIVGAVAAATVAAALGSAAVGSAAATPAVASAHASAVSNITVNSSTAATLHGKDVMKQMAAALAKAPGVRMSGNAADGGDAFTSETHVDAIMMQGSLSSITLTQGDDTLSILSVGGSAYLKAPGATYLDSGVPAETSTLLNNEWVKVLPQDTKELLDGYTLTSLANMLKNPTLNPVLDKVTMESRGGRSLLTVSQSDGSKIYIDPTTYLPVEITSPSTAPNGVLDYDFLDYGISVPVTAPADPLVAQSDGQAAGNIQDSLAA